jgi:putative aldouronate transport system permease protein
METGTIAKKPRLGRLRWDDWLIRFVLLLFGFATAYPFVYVFSMAFSSTSAVLKQEVFLWPVGFSIESFKVLAKDGSFFTAYYNTIWYTAVGTVINLLFTVLAAYPLSKKRLPGRGWLTFFIMFTAFFSGGLIPTFVLVYALGIYNTRLPMVLLYAAMPMYIVLCRTFFQGIPQDLEEAAIIDGSGEVGIMLQIYLPLSKAIIAVLLVFFAIFHWNNFWTALIYVSRKELQPLQLVLRRILIEQSPELLKNIPGSTLERTSMSIQLKYSAIVASILPILCVYPLVQKYFVMGIMVGSLKG